MTLENHSGRTSGKPYVTPMMYLEGDGVMYTFASKASVPTHPDRYYNLFSGKAAAVQVGTKTYATLASTASTPASSAASKPDALDISGFSYDPSPLTVQAGATVTRTNQDSADHTLDSDVASLFTSSDVTRGTPVRFVTPKRAGRYTFHCAYHSKMHGTLVVSG